MIRSESCLGFLAFTERDEGYRKLGAESWLGQTFQKDHPGCCVTDRMEKDKSKGRGQPNPGER